MHILNVALCRCRHCIKVYIDSQYISIQTLNLRLWLFLVMLHPPAATSRYQSRQNLNCFIELLPIWKRAVLGFVLVLAVGFKMNHGLQSQCFSSRYFCYVARRWNISTGADGSQLVVSNQAVSLLNTLRVSS